MMGLLERVACVLLLVSACGRIGFAAHDGHARADVYTNGDELPVATVMNATGTRPSDAGIGLSINCTATAGLAGRIDDVRLWPRALSSTEVRALYDATR